jgi:hypothetical protein
MATDGQEELDEREERFFTLRKLRTVLIGSVVALVAGIAITFVYTSVEYGGSPFDHLFGSRKPNPAIGKLAFDKNTHYFIGTIKSDGYSVRRSAQVFYIERPGGGLIEVPKSLVDVRDRGQQP